LGAAARRGLNGKTYGKLDTDRIDKKKIGGTTTTQKKHDVS